MTKSAGIFSLFALCILLTFRLSAQQQITDGRLIWLLGQQDTLQKLLTIEKAYLQTDKPFYNLGDTIWFKAYIFDADYLHYTSRSGLLYIELANDSAEVISRTMLPLKYGLSWGQIAIDPKDIPQGSYTLKAYTNWMRNFGENYVFSKNLYITGAGDKPWLVNVKTTSAIADQKENIHSAITFANAGKTPVMLREMHVRVQDNDRTLVSGKTQTGVDGMLNINFNLSPKINPANLNLHTEDLRKGEGNRQMDIPLVLNRPEKTDLQFMPESGNLVAGITSRVGFKALGEDGHGINVSGKIYDSKQAEAASFTSLHKGMGAFTFTPMAGETYVAKVTLPDGFTKSYNLPVVKSSGTTLSIQNNTAPDSIKIKLSSAGLQPASYYLIGQSRGVICYVHSIKLDSCTTRNFTIAKTAFPSGIARFSLLTNLGRPLNERIIYVDEGDNLNIKIYPVKQHFAARDSIALQVEVTDHNRQPVQGSFSLAVTDNYAITPDSLAANLTTSLLFTSDLKGTVEEPEYYLMNNLQSQAAMDNLLLTQGWVGYDWAQVVSPPEVTKFDAEGEFQIKGKVINLFNKPIAGTKVMVLSKKAGLPRVTQTDAKGSFLFKDFPVTDSAIFFVEGVGKHGGSFGISLTVDQNPAPQFAKPIVRYLPWFVNTDTTLQKSVSKIISQQLAEEHITGDHLLKNVEIRDKKIIRGSHNLNGPGEADEIIDEHAINKVGDLSLEDLLEKKIKGFRATLPMNLYSTYYMVGPRIANFFIDGIDIKTHGKYIESRSFLDNFTAGDIKGIEVMNNVKYKMNYDPATITSGGAISHEIGCMGCPPPPMFIEITTKANTGPYAKHTPGTYVYRPVPYNIPKQFYTPKYIVKTPSVIKDFRSTIYWDPNIITGKDGKATVTFYASDSANSYNMIMEGSDMNGNIGSVKQTLTGIKNAP